MSASSELFDHAVLVLAFVSLALVVFRHFRRASGSIRPVPQNSPGEKFVLIIFALVVVAQFAITKLWHPLSYSEYRFRLLLPSLVIGVLVSFIPPIQLTWNALVHIGGRYENQGSGLILSLFVATLCNATGEILNGVLDHSPGVSTELTVLEKGTSNALSDLLSEDGGDEYVVRVADARSPASTTGVMATTEISANDSIYKRVSVGKSRVMLVWHPGALGVSWYENVQIVP